MKTAWIVGITALALLGPACGGGDDTAAGDPDVETPAQAADSSNEADGDCPLTTEDVRAVVGLDVSDIGCAWTSDVGGEGVSPDDLRIDVFYSAYPASLFSTYRQQAEDRSDVVTVDGVGDEAYTETDSGLSVLAGELAFSIHVAVHNGDPDADFDPRAAERELALLILERQP